MHNRNSVSYDKMLNCKDTFRDICSVKDCNSKTMHQTGICKLHRVKICSQCSRTVYGNPSELKMRGTRCGHCVKRDLGNPGRSIELPRPD